VTEYTKNCRDDVFKMKGKVYALNNIPPKKKRGGAQREISNLNLERKELVSSLSQNGRFQVSKTSPEISSKI
jgi:hypothetical protein